MKDNEFKIYEKLYDIVAEGMRDSNQTFITKVVFINSLNIEIDRTNLRVLNDVPAEEFIYAAFMAILRRAPGNEDLAAWNKVKENEGEYEFKRKLVKTLVESDERKVKRVIAYNDVFNIDEEYINNNAQYRTNKLLRIGLKLYHRLPYRLKVRIKSIVSKMGD